MRYALAMLLATCLAAGCDDEIEDPPPRPDGGVASVRNVRHKVVVAHHPGVSLDRAAVLGKLDDATSRVAAAHDAHDHSCCFEFELAEVRPNGRLPIRVETPRDLDLIRTADAAIHGAFTAVDAFLFCGEAVDPSGRNIGGCTRTGRIPAVVRAGSSGAIWAHEFGHSQWLGHPECVVTNGAARIMHNGCPNEEIMHRLTPFECRAFRRLRPASEIEAVASGEGARCTP